VSGRVLAVCVSGSDLYRLPTRRSGIRKLPVTGRVAVHALGLDGDVQVNTKHHGGEGQAVYAYARRTPAGGSGSSAVSCPPAGSARTCAPAASTCSAPSSGSGGGSGRRCSR